MSGHEEAPPGAPRLALYQGSANTWECDEMGHLNVRFYVARAMEGVALLAAALGMPHAFRRDARATLTPLDQHIRFLKEARPGAPLAMTGGVVALSETEAVFYQELRHGDGALAATFRTRLRHAQPDTLRAFPWSHRTRASAAAHACTIPPEGAGRSIDPEGPIGDASLQIAESLGVAAIGRGMVGAHECDALGRMRPEFVIARVSDAVPNLMAAWREAIARRAVGEAEGKGAAGAAVLEYRIAYRAWPEAGDLIEVRSAVTEVEEKTHRLTHWLLDPVSGKAWATSEAVAVTFNLKTRKVIPTPTAERDVLRARAIPSFRI